MANHGNLWAIIRYARSRQIELPIGAVISMVWLSFAQRFDEDFYVRTYPDTETSGLPPLLHYVLRGRHEGRHARPHTNSSTAAEADDARERRPSLYIVPAFMGNRNTKRYRANHLAESCADIAHVQLIDFRDPPENFFSTLKGRSGIVVLQRLSTQDAASIPFLKALRNTGRPVFYDIDDLLFDREQLEDWRLDSWDISPAQYLDAMAYADSFIAATPALAGRLQAFFGKPAVNLPNVLNRQQLDASEEARKTPPAPEGRFVVGYASGSASHDHDLDVALPAIEQFMTDHLAAELHCIGDVMIPEAFAQRFSDRIILRAKIPWFDLPHELARFDIQIIPLVSTPFNACKSHIRFLESAAVKVPTLCSGVGQQAESITDGKTGILAENSAKSWYEGLKRYYDDPSLRLAIAEAAYRQVTTTYTCEAPSHIANVRSLLFQAGDRVS